MAGIADAFDAAFRDFATDGVPSSGKHNPVKSEVRALGSLIEGFAGGVLSGAAYGMVPDSDGTTGDGTNYLTHFQELFAAAKALGPGTRIVLPSLPGKHYRVSGTLELPDIAAATNNSAIGGGYELSGTGMSGSGIFFDANSGWAIESENFDLAGPRLGVYIHDLHIFGRAMGAGSGGIRLRNPRLATVERCFIHSFPFGTGIQIYGDSTGGAWYCRIRDNMIGWWHLGSGSETPVLGVDDKWWMNKGIELIGDEDDSGKTDECIVEGNAIWNCKEAYLSLTGHDSDGNIGVPDSGQGGLLGGSAYNRAWGNSFYGAQATRVFQGTLVSATSSTVTLPSGYVATNDYYNGLDIWIASGTGIGQKATVLDFVGSTGVLTIAGAFDTTPDETSHVNIGHYAVGVLYDSAGGFHGMGAYMENVPVPVRCTANADRHFEWFGNNLKNTSTGIYFDVKPALSGTAAAGSSSTITLAAASFSKIDNAYKGRLIETTGGTGSGQTRKIASSVGSTGVCTVESNWSPAPNNTTTYTIKGGSMPRMLLGGGFPRYPTQRPTGMQLPATGLQVGDASIFDTSGFFAVWINSTGGALTAGTVVRQGTSGSKNLASSATANADCPLVVWGEDATSYADGGETLVARSGAEVTVLVDTTVNETDTLVASTTTGQATVNNSQTDPKKIIGYATTVDAAGACRVRIL